MHITKETNFNSMVKANAYNLFFSIVMMMALVLTSCGGKNGSVESKAIKDSIVFLRDSGKHLRNESRFGEALRVHDHGLRLAEATGDTIEWVQALNNIGTDYRRMGVLDAALSYHLRAWSLAKECGDTAFMARKNRVVSLNGLANVYLTTGNLNRADSALRMALDGERQLGSLTGQAINYANIGSIFETRGQTDSAWTYYRRSMELNQKDNNALGVALCHTYFGNLYKRSHDLDKALAEYEKAHDIMRSSKDEWHVLNSLTALAGLYIAKGEYGEAEQRLIEAKLTAEKIKSKEHLAEIYTLYYKMRKQQGDWHGALASLEKAGALQDSLIDMEKVNKMQNISYAIEQQQQTRRMTEANNRLTSERSYRKAGFVIFSVIILLLIAVVALLIHNRQLRAKSHKALIRLNEVRETFFRNITHEFRTPLTVILGLSQDVQQPSASPGDIREMGKTIERQGNHMLRLINQLLDISKVRSEVGTPDWRSGNIVAYMRMIAETFDGYAQSRGIKLQFVCRENDVETDFVPDYLSKVLGNLLSNSLKHTPQGGTISMTVWRNTDKLLIDVADTGKGISAECLPHIFEPFYQADGGDGIGTGIGLALVWQIMKTIGGSITVESKEGKGTTFHLIHPVVHNHAPAIDTKALQSTELSADHLSDANNTDICRKENNEMYDKRVLVVEDNADIAEYIGKRLTGRYNVSYASDGKSGLAMARELLPDTIITDLMMPGMDGLELTRQIRADELTSHIPVIVVTAKVTEQDRIEGLKAGADAYLTKPFNSDELQTRVKKLMEQRRMLREKYASETIGDKNPENGKDLPTPADRAFTNRLTDVIYLLVNSGKSADMQAIASKMGMSYSQLYRKTIAVTNMTPAQYAQRIKVAKAKRMLKAHPETPLAEIALQCGFSDYSNFVRAFKNLTGKTPTQFVRQE